MAEQVVMVISAQRSSQKLKKMYGVECMNRTQVNERQIFSKMAETMSILMNVVGDQQPAELEKASPQVCVELQEEIVESPFVSYRKMSR